MRFTFNKYDYYIEFNHRFDAKEWNKSLVSNHKAVTHSASKLIQPNVTLCTIYRGPIGSKFKDMTVFCQGKATRCVLDQFIKAQGCKVALTDALFRTCVNKKKPNKEFRTQAWAAFNNRKKNSNNSIVKNIEPTELQFAD